MAAVQTQSAIDTQTINIIDCDLHHSTKKQEDLFLYLPRHYVEHIKDFGTMMPGVGYTNMPRGGVRAELWEGQEEHPGGNIDLAREKHLDVHGIDIAVLSGSTVYVLRSIQMPIMVQRCVALSTIGHLKLGLRQIPVSKHLSLSLQQIHNRLRKKFIDLVNIHRFFR